MKLKPGILQFLALAITTILVFVMCLIVFYNITGDISWCEVSNPASYNATVNTIDSFFNVGPIVMGIAFVFIFIGIVLAWTVLPTDAIKENKAIWFLSRSFYYFGYGLLGLVCFGPPAMLGYFLYDFTVVQGNTASLFSLLKWVLLLIIAYFSIAGFGFCFKKIIVDRIKKKFKKKG
jgi:hypothetical protein